MLVVTPVKVTNQPMNSWSLSRGSSKVFFIMSIHQELWELGIYLHLLGWPENMEDSSIESFLYFFKLFRTTVYQLIDFQLFISWKLL